MDTTVAVTVTFGVAIPVSCVTAKPKAAPLAPVCTVVAESNALALFRLKSTLTPGTRLPLRSLTVAVMFVVF